MLTPRARVLKKYYDNVAFKINIRERAVSRIRYFLIVNR